MMSAEQKRIEKIKTKRLKIYCRTKNYKNICRMIIYLKIFIDPLTLQERLDNLSEAHNLK